MIFIDSDFYIGLYHRLDLHHKHCLELKEKIDKEELITSFEVVNEVATKMSYFLTKEVSLVF